MPDPADPATFELCRPSAGASAGEDPEALAWLALHGDLLALRRAVLPAEGERTRVSGAALGASALCLRYERPGAPARLLLVNWGADLDLAVRPEPRLAPPPGARWALLWSSEDPRYGGAGTPALEDARWLLPADSARLLRAEEARDERA